LQRKPVRGKYGVACEEASLSLVLKEEAYKETDPNGHGE